MKKLITLVSTEGKSKEKIKNEVKTQLREKGLLKSVLPKNLFKNGFALNGDKIDINLLENIRQFIRINFKKRETINYLIGSYELKHIVERRTKEYVSNGELISSMILEGFDYKIDNKNQLNAYFNLTKVK